MSPEDQSALEMLAHTLVESWNRHDADAYAANFAPECTLVDLSGQILSGRKEVRDEVSAMFAGRFSRSEATLGQIKLIEIAAGVAGVLTRCDLRGDAANPGKVQRTRGTGAAVKRDGAWKFVTLHAGVLADYVLD
ncbi:MAG: SgcJ/EcaC family oxidoreductase [Hyphomonadaceae bacterium]